MTFLFQYSFSALYFWRKSKYYDSYYRNCSVIVLQRWHGYCATMRIFRMIFGVALFLISISCFFYSETFCERFFFKLVKLFFLVVFVDICQLWDQFKVNFNDFLSSHRCWSSPSHAFQLIHLKVSEEWKCLMLKKRETQIQQHVFPNTHWGKL